MTPDEKVAQFLALARSTPFTSERETAVSLARKLFNKYRLSDARLRWDLLRALGLEAGPEPARPQASQARTADGEDWAAWREWMAAEQAEQERWTRAWMKRAQQRQRADPASPRRRASATKTGTQRRRGTSGRGGAAVQAGARPGPCLGADRLGCTQLHPRDRHPADQVHLRVVREHGHPPALPWPSAGVVLGGLHERRSAGADPGARTPLSGAPTVIGCGDCSGRERRPLP